jgi:AraC family transcriptional regulator, arabinose operon regulatory protein
MSDMIFPTITDKESKLPFYLAGVGYQHEQEHVVRPNGYPYFQWIQGYHGEGEIITADGTYKVRENQGMLLYPDEPHEYYSITNFWKVDWIILGGHQVAEFLKNSGMDKTGIYYVSQPDLLLSKIRNALNMAKSGDTMWSLDCSIMVYDFLISLTKYTSLEGTGSALQRYSKLKPVFDYIEENYKKQLSLEELANIISISPHHLCVLFRNTLNSRVFEYVNNVRIQKSKELILTGRDRRIKEISRLAGFEDLSYFCSVFRKIERVSPGEFKKLHWR